MYFTILNVLLGLFFLFLIIIGVLLRYWSYIPVNVIGMVVITLTLFLDKYHHLSPPAILFLLFTLVVIIGTDIIFVYRDFREEVTEVEAVYRRKYIVDGILPERYKIIKDETIIQNEIDQYENVPMSDRVQAFKMLQLGNDAFMKQDYQEALTKYELSTNWLPTGVGYLNQSGVLLKLGKYKEALSRAEKASQIRSGFYEALINQGVALEKLKQYEKAFLKYKSAARINPTEYEVWLLCAHVLFKMNKFEEAIEYYTKSLNLYGRQFEAWYYKGIALQKSGKEVDALQCFQQAIRIKSSHAKVYYRLGNILFKLNRDTEAIEAYGKAINLNPESVETWNNLGVVLNKIGHVKEAIRCYDRAIKINPEHADAWLNKALAQDNSGQHKKALISYQKFLEVAPPRMKKQRNIAQKRIDDIKAMYKIREKKKFGLAKFGLRNRKMKAEPVIEDSLNK